MERNYITSNQEIKMADTSLNDKLVELAKDQEERVTQVGQLQEQIQQSQSAISALKEAHDHTRGKIDMIRELLDADEATETEKDATRDKK